MKILCVCLLLVVGIGSTTRVKAQCAQCVATVESNRQAGNDGLAKGLNHGIMYLLAAPYVAIAAAGYLWYKKYRRKNVDLNIRSEKLNLN